jgi:quinol monooxygenase YgiN
MSQLIVNALLFISRASAAIRRVWIAGRRLPIISVFVSKRHSEGEDKETPMYEEQVTVIAYIEIRQGTEEAFKAELDKLIAATRAESACVNYDFHQSVKQSTHFFAYENWASMDGLDRHAKSSHIQTFRQNCAEMFVKPAEITIWKKLD